MQLVLVEDGRIDERLARTYGAINNMENNINFCNKVIRDLIEPITHSKNRISVRLNYTDYNNLMELATLLRSNDTREMFKTIREDLHKNLPSNLNDIPMSEVKDLLDSDLKAYDIDGLIINIENLLSKRRKAKNDKDGSHLINFIAY